MYQPAPQHGALRCGSLHAEGNIVKTVTIAEAIEEIRKGRMIILVDNEDRENEGDLVIAAEFCRTPPR